MSKARERAIEKFPIEMYEDVGWMCVDKNADKRQYFIEGYHQAEKDLELTNADVYDIWRIYNEVCAEGKILGFDETSQEVLKRFKDLKK